MRAAAVYQAVPYEYKGVQYLQVEGSAGRAGFDP